MITDSKRHSTLTFKPAVLRGDWFRWLAARPPASRVLTREECHILAREADALYEQFDAVNSRIESVMASWYRHSPNLIAHMCDEGFDPSGALLGRVRQRVLDGPSTPASREES